MTLLPLMLALLLVVPSLAQAATFWDDEMQDTTAGQFYYEPWFSGGNYTHDTATKFSGTASTRVNFPLACDIPGPGLTGQCGGSITRTFSPYADVASVYKRVYFMMSGSSTPLTAPSSNCITTNCLFKTSGLSSTKMFQGASADQNTFTEKNIRHWWQLGKNGGNSFIVSEEHVPTYFATTDVYSSHVMQNNRWYCIETHEVVNTPGVANGVAQAWIDGVQVVNDTDVIWQRVANGTVSPGNFLWHQFQLVRQNGAGYFWFDRFAAGDARIGCIGTIPAGDITNPNPPTSLTAQ